MIDRYRDRYLISIYLYLYLKVISYNILPYMITEAEKSHDLPSASWRASGVDCSPGLNA